MSRVNQNLSGVMQNMTEDMQRSEISSSWFLQNTNFVSDKYSSVLSLMQDVPVIMLFVDKQSVHLSYMYMYMQQSVVLLYH